MEPARKRAIHRYWKQCRALSRKHWVLRLRGWRVNLLQVFQSTMFMLIIYITSLVVNRSSTFSEARKTNKNPEAIAVDAIPLCRDNLYLRKDRPCYTVIYSPDNSTDADMIMEGVIVRNDPPIPKSQVLRFKDSNAVNKYLADNPQTVQAAVNFLPGVGQAPNSMGFVIQTNSTGQYFRGKYLHPNFYAQIPLQTAVEREGVRLMVAKSQAAAAARTAGNVSDPAAGLTAMAQGTTPPAALPAPMPLAPNGTVPAAEVLPGSPGAPATSPAVTAFGTSSTGDPAATGTSTGPQVIPVVAKSGGAAPAPEAEPGAASVAGRRLLSDSASARGALPMSVPVPFGTVSRMSDIVSGVLSSKSGSASSRSLLQAPDVQPIPPGPYPPNGTMAPQSSMPASWDVGFKIFAHPATIRESFVGRIAPTFIFISAIFNFILVLYNIVQEKELGLRQAMETMGLMWASHWTIWILWEYAMATLAALMIQALGYAFQFNLWTKNSFGLTFLIVWLTFLVITTLAFVISTLCRKASTTVPVGFIFFFLAWIMILVVGFGFPYDPDFSTAAQVIFSFFPWDLLALAFADLGDAAVSDSIDAGISWANRDKYCFKNVPSPEQQQGLGYWKSRCVVSVGDCINYLAIQIAAWLAIALYLDLVVPNGMGESRNAFFFLTPSFWGYGSLKHGPAAAKKALRAAELAAEGQETAALYASDIIEAEAKLAQTLCHEYVSGRTPTLVPAEREGAAAAARAIRAAILAGKAPAGVSQQQAQAEPGAAKAFCPAAASGLAPAAPELQPVPYPAAEIDPGASAAGQSLAPPLQPRSDTGSPDEPRPAVALFGLSKTFSKRKLWANRRPFKKEEFKAVRPTWLTLEHGKCFCLLGPNGAGKTTSIRMLTGILSISGGEAVIWGQSATLPSGKGRIRSLMGICPQFDVLWGDMTAMEHMELFAAIKGLDGGKEECMSLLREVRLDDVANRRAMTFSGGMKRRLSCAVAMLGDPLILFLDEPTTGMDPISRRHVWQVIDRCKRDRVVVLTTHSMQEADVLGDRVGIMARGSMRALGTGLQLKAAYGSGYRLAVLLEPEVDASGAAGMDADLKRKLGEMGVGADGTATQAQVLATSATPGLVRVPAAVLPPQGPAGTESPFPSGSGSGSSTATGTPFPSGDVSDDSAAAEDHLGGGTGSPDSSEASGPLPVPPNTTASPVEPSADGNGSGIGSGAGDASDATGTPAPEAPEGPVRRSSTRWTRADVVATFIRCQISSLEPITSDTLSGPSDALEYKIPRELEGQVGDLLDALEANRAALGIRDVYLMASPMEEVFLAVVRDAELQYARECALHERVFVEEADGSTVGVDVAIGEAALVTPGGVRYRVDWRQDEEGKLHASGCDKM